MTTSEYYYDPAFPFAIHGGYEFFLTLCLAFGLFVPLFVSWKMNARKRWWIVGLLFLIHEGFFVVGISLATKARVESFSDDKGFNRLLWFALFFIFLGVFMIPLLNEKSQVPHITFYVVGNDPANINSSRKRTRLAIFYIVSSWIAIPGLALMAIYCKQVKDGIAADTTAYFGPMRIIGVGVITDCVHPAPASTGSKRRRIRQDRLLSSVMEQEDEHRHHHRELKCGDFCPYPAYPEYTGYISVGFGSEWACPSQPGKWCEANIPENKRCSKLRYNSSNAETCISDLYQLNNDKWAGISFTSPEFVLEQSPEQDSSWPFANFYGDCSSCTAMSADSRAAHMTYLNRLFVAGITLCSVAGAMYLAMLGRWFTGVTSFSSSTVSPPEVATSSIPSVVGSPVASFSSSAVSPPEVATTSIPTVPRGNNDF